MLDNVKRRKKTWFVNALMSLPIRVLSKPRDMNTWVFGCWDGMRYDDSPRYVYEYILSDCPEIKPVWISKKEDIVERLRDSGKPAFLVGTKDAKKIMLNAGVAFYSNGLDDFGNICYVNGALIINLNHGAMPIKELDYCEFDKISKMKSLLKKIRNNIFNWMYFDYLVVTSEKGKRRYMKAYAEYNEDKILCAGLPRYDVLFNADYIKKSKPDFWRADTKYILYLPTFRTYPNSVIADFISAIESLKEKEKISLEGITFIVKPHPVEQIKRKINDNLIIIDKNHTISTQELLSVSDVLITDYSSCCIDFCVINKPIIFYTPDHEVYSLKIGVLEDFSYIYQSPDCLKTPLELIKNVNDIVKNHKGVDLSKTLNQEYNEYCYKHKKDNSSCSEVIVRLIRDKLNCKVK